jgi:hypothetical protein
MFTRRTHVNKVRALEGVFCGVRCKLSLETSTKTQDREEEFGGSGGPPGDDDARSIQTIVLHKLERVEEDDEGWRTWRVELDRPRTPEHMSLEMSHSPEEEEMARSYSSNSQHRPPSWIPPLSCRLPFKLNIPPPQSTISIFTPKSLDPILIRPHRCSTTGDVWSWRGQWGSHTCSCRHSCRRMSIDSTLHISQLNPLRLSTHPPDERQQTTASTAWREARRER